MNAERLLPEIDDESRPFWDAAQRGELCVQRCADTGRLIFPPRARSPWGARLEPEWATVSGRGTIWSFVVAHPPLLPWFAEHAPYNVIVVALDEDPTIRLVGNLVKTPDGPLDEVDPHTVEIGAAVRVVFERVGDSLSLPRWVSAGPTP